MLRTNTETIGFVAFMIAVVVWRAWETYQKQGSVRGMTSMMWSFYAMVALTVLIFGGTVLEFFLVKRVFHPSLSLLGVLLFILANLLRLRAIRTLGNFWSLHVEIRERHQFVRGGPYAFIRHPAYTSFVMEHVAVPLVGNAWWSLTATVLLYIPMILLRLNKEESALVGKFGDAYRAYQREVGALVPKPMAFRRGLVPR
jgi:protein-S-isoprenylcysteine O-methyltransferase Ste14